jgi:hypothetical protein
MEIPATDFPEKPTPQLSARLSMAQHVTMILGDYCEIGVRAKSENVATTVQQRRLIIEWTAKL